MTTMTMMIPSEDYYLFNVEYNGTKLGLSLSIDSSSSNHQAGSSVFVKDNESSVSNMVAIGDIVMSINNINVHQIKNQWEVMEMIQNALLASDGVGEGIPKCIITFKRPIPPITLREQDIFADPQARHSYRETDGTAHYYKLLECSYDKYYQNGDINNKEVMGDVKN
jgi:hypothetical protein